MYKPVELTHFIYKDVFLFNNISHAFQFCRDTMCQINKIQIESENFRKQNNHSIINIVDTGQY